MVAVAAGGGGGYAAQRSRGGATHVPQVPGSIPAACSTISDTLYSSMIVFNLHVCFVSGVGSLLSLVFALAGVWHVQDLRPPRNPPQQRPGFGAQAQLVSENKLR